MNLSYFREFIVLADTSNYLEAAERLFMGQSTLSKHIMAMERELGVPLFERTSRKVVLSKYGKLLLPHARTIVQAEYDYTADLENELESMRGRVTVGTVSATAKYRITEVLANYKRRYPNSSVRMIEGDPNDLIGQLKARKCDMIFAHLPNNSLEEAGLHGFQYCEDSLVCVFPKSHPLAKEKVLPLERLQDETFIALAENSVAHNLVLESCHRVGFSPKIAFFCNRIDSVLDLVTKEMGIAILMENLTVRPEDSNFPDRAPFSVVQLQPHVTAPVYLCYRADEELSPAAKHFVQSVQEEIASRNEA
ncbi:MAG: LysR family transcriptional regulator [Clostridiales bacterium]|nr:LysR family transcriptional regulator [Clostridiales bacterium]